jgi:hypothetical protein
VTYNWTRQGRRWTLDAAPRYAVEQRADSLYEMFVDGYEVDSADTAEVAMARLASVFEYEEHRSDLEEARLQLRQIGDRLRERFPRAARDGEVASLYACLRNALGEGPEAADPAPADREPDIFRQDLSPDLAVVVDASQCIVLEVTDGAAGRVLRRPTVSNIDAHIRALDDARVAQAVALFEGGYYHVVPEVQD